MRCGLLLFLCFCFLGRLSAADPAYFDRPKIDFDTAMELLNPYGTWSKIDDRWAYTPLDHTAPYQHGQWLYTDYGWYWQGVAPHSWMTEHYGFWKRGVTGVWSWYPAPDWLPQIVELRATSTAIGWRCAEVDATGSFVEEPADRYARPDEWTFVSRADFLHPIDPKNIVPAKVAASLLDDSTSCMHTYVTYRAIERPGPHPADFFSRAHGSAMFPPAWEEDPSRISSTSSGKTTPAAAIPAAVHPLMDAATITPSDARQVRYWTTLNLPSFSTSPPADARPNEIYLFRPEIYQDQEGIERRIRLWLNPRDKAVEKGNLQDALRGAPHPGSGPTSPAGPATDSPFRNPFDETYHGETSHATAPPATNAAPSGRSDQPPASH